MNAYSNTERGRIASALSHIPAHDRDLWLKMGMAVKSELPDDEGFAVWSEWSQQDDSYKENDALAVWRSIDPHGGVSIGSVFHEAMANGWTHQGEVAVPSPAALAQRKAERAKAEVTRQAKEARKRAAAMEKAAAIWAAAMPAGTDHPYLVRKQVAPTDTLRELAVDAVAAILGYVPKSSGEPLAGRVLVAPVHAGDMLTTCELIDGTGRKCALYGGAKAGGYWAAQSLPDGDGAGLVLFIAEGVATTLTVHMATCQPCIAALSSNNLLAVTKAMRKRYPAALLALVADLVKATGEPDHHAAKAAQAVDGLLIVPDFGDQRAEGETDINDMAARFGLDVVRGHIEIALSVHAATPDAQEAPQDDIASADTPAPAKAKGKPMEPDSETCSYAGGTFDVSGRGVFFIGTDKDNNELPPRWICSRLGIVAKTRDAKSGEWGRLLEWCDDDKVRHQWAMPLELLQSDGTDMRRELARMGLTISPVKAQRDLLAAFVQVWPVKSRARCVERLGWHGAVYVTPAESIGQDAEIVVFQNAHAIEPAFSVAGTLDGWRASVAALAAGNSRLVFTLSVAFAGTLADVVGEDSGGFHLRGGSSSGKTTALKVAASVWGDPNTYPRLWRATANGLEGLAALHNDGLLILDELSQVDPKEAGEAAYLLANGQGKARASRTGTARQASRWRLLFLSAGEESLTALMARVGKKANTGQEIRLADIDADAGAGMGAFETLYDQPSPAALALAVKDAAIRCHGAVGVAWLRCIVADRATLADDMADGIKSFVVEAVPKDAAGQVLRVARRFALVAMAGELATHYGLTGWGKGEAIGAARKCFAAWLDAFGGIGNREERNVLSQVRAFFEAHGASRFEDMTATSDQRIINRAGFYRTGADGGREFLVLPEAFKRDVCAGFDTRAAVLALVAAGWLQPGNDGKTAQKPRIPGIGPTRCYVFTARMWEGE
ncbi:DUF927 domain-containing protein [Pseudoduganella namucuonensis]|uniref:Uncharcterized protein, DUF927 family n=1 Tax=Pseudoduganella namucuonensis TaxID=1035707 RepID=A0A1I7M0K8_9BURK|nr:DUF927 domain-containing protein [Pseudoduganella namucuonensis]SFV15501.1 Uncharcterized protein, DUF927 family [Pseudoduganella namucuonensis]